MVAYVRTKLIYDLMAMTFSVKFGNVRENSFFHESREFHQIYLAEVVP